MIDLLLDDKGFTLKPTGSDTTWWWKYGQNLANRATRMLDSSISIFLISGGGYHRGQGCRFGNLLNTTQAKTILWQDVAFLSPRHRNRP